MKSKFHLRCIYLALFFSFYSIINAQAQDSHPWAWVKSLSATNGIYGNAIAIDPKGTGDIYVAGGFEGATDFDPGPGTFPLSSGSSNNVGIFISKYDGLGNFLWARAMAGAGGAAFALSVAIDPVDGAIYTTGRVDGTVDFDPGPNTFNLTSSTVPCSVGYPFCGDIFISKIDREGNFVWALVIGAQEDDFGNSLAVDPGGSGDVYIMGQFKGTVDFDPGSDSFNLTSAGNYDIFISKINSSGHFLWALTIGGIGSDISRAIAIDPRGSGTVYTTGYFQETVDFDPGDDTFNLTTAFGQQNNFISKLDSSGHFVWAKQMGRVGPVGNEPAGAIALDLAGSGDVYTTGSFQGTCDFNPGDDTYNLSSAGMSDIFISKLDSSGHFGWAKARGGTNRDFGTAIAIISGKNEGIYTVGNFRETVNFNPGQDSFNVTSIGGREIFIYKSDTSGNFQWIKVIKGTNDDYCHSIAIDEHSLYLTGFFNSSSISFDSLTIPNINTAGTGDDLFVAKLDLTSLRHGPIFVKQNAAGNNDGTSWQNAFTKFQDALDYADNGDQIWIAAGTYIPEGPSADSSHFLLKKGVEIYGGFNGTESTLSERKLWTDITTLSGDILGDDLPSVSDSSTNRSDNAHHVLILDCGGNETIIDGLEFKGGSTQFYYGNDSTGIQGYDRRSGGALYIRNTPAKIRNCLFRDNYGFIGSCLFSRGDSSNSNYLLIANSIFVQNRGTFGAGIVLDFRHSDDGGHYEIDSCTFDSNISFGVDGGVITSINNQLLLSTGAIRNSEFLYNHEGAVFSYGEKLLIENCIFKGNYILYDYPWWAGRFGSAIAFEIMNNNYPKNITVRNTIFSDNYYEWYGGAVSIEGAVNALFENVLFYRNSGNYSLFSNGNIKLLNNTMVDNEVGLDLNLSFPDYAEIQNCIFDNEGENLSTESWAEGSGIFSKGGNISSDSTLASYLKGYNGYADLHQTNPLLGSDFVPLPGSPCIDAGNPEGVLAPFDLAGNPRIQGHEIDAGAYESPFMVAVKDAVWDSQVFSVYPNPVIDVLNFELESDWIGKIRLRVYNNQGQPVYKSEMNKSGRIQTFKENLNLLPPGEYVVLAIAGKTTYATKVIFLR